VLGFDAHYDTLHTEKISAQTGDTTWHASSSIIGAWLELKKDFGGITVIPRLRFDSNSDYGTFFSPGLGIVSAITHNVWAKISLERAFRAPTFNDLYWPRGGNPELKPEQAWAYELRLEASPVHQLFTALSFYMRQVQDRIVWLPTESSLWQPQNANFLDISGIDLEMRSQVSDVLGLSFEGTYLRAQQQNNELVYDFYDWVADTGRTIIEEVEREAAFTPQYRFSAAVVVTIPHDFVLVLTGVLAAEQVNYYPNYENYPHVSMDEKVLDGYYVMNLDATKSLFNMLTCGVGVRNIFDVDYATQFGFTIDDLDYPMPGRLVYAHVLWRL
jgi:outer membrane cobalamin receptor